jgi:glutathione S-transferase
MTWTAMTGNDHRYILRSTLTSPFGRKVRIAMAVLGLDDRIRVEPADTLDEADTLRAQNPLGKMPCLLLPDGTPVFDSRVIIELLQELAGSASLIPAGGPDRYRTLTRATLADGVTEAALLVTYEGRFREPQQASARWLEHQRGKITRALAAFEHAPPDPQRTDLVSITLACALGYLDWRKPLDWRPHNPQLVQWLEKFAEHEPEFLRSRAPGS